jgi:Outer membrane protein beta-barrel domain
MKRISFLICTLFAGTFVFAQEASIGIKGGLNIAHLASNESEMGSRLGGHVGLLAHIHLAPNLAVQPEVVYSSQGTKYTSTDGEHELSINYLNIPLQLQYMFAGGFRIQTGPQIGFLTSVKDKRNGSETGFFSSDDFKSVDFSWSAGLGYLTNSGLGVDARYNFGLSNINDAGSATLKNDVFQVGLFYQFNNRPYRK